MKRNWFFIDKNKLLTIYFMFKIRDFLPKLFGIAFHFAAFSIIYTYVGYSQPPRISLIWVDIFIIIENTF